MISNIGVPGLILILILALLVFGPSKLPQIGRAFGETLREFRDTTRSIIGNDEEEAERTKDKK